MSSFSANWHVNVTRAHLFLSSYSCGFFFSRRNSQREEQQTRPFTGGHDCMRKSNSCILREMKMYTTRTWNRNLRVGLNMECEWRTRGTRRVRISIFLCKQKNKRNRRRDTAAARYAFVVVGMSKIYILYCCRVLSLVLSIEQFFFPRRRWCKH